MRISYEKNAINIKEDSKYLLIIITLLFLYLHFSEQIITFAPLIIASFI